MIRLAVVDDHPVVAAGIRTLVSSEADLELVGCALTAAEGIALIEDAQPHVVLLDLRLGSVDSGLDLIESASEVCPQCRCIVFSSFAEPSQVRRALSQDVWGYLLKEAPPEELLSAVRLVHQGRRFFDAGIIEGLVRTENSGELRALSCLTPREREVLEVIARGMSNQEIARHLFITENTVKKHVGSILSKLDLEDRTQAAVFAISNGLAGKLGD